jgi:flagellin
MRSQIKGLHQATANANDGISLIQTAEGGLNEVHAILQRMRELSVQSANGTYQDDTDREAMTLETEALKSEIDRISGATEYNGIKLLDGSLGTTQNITNKYGANYGVRKIDPTNSLGMYNLASNVANVRLKFTATASGDGGESAIYVDPATTSPNLNIKEIQINLVDGKYYSDAQINDLIAKALQPKDLIQSPPTVTWTTDAAGFVMDGTKVNVTDVTSAGVRATNANQGLTDGNLFALTSGSSNTAALSSSDSIIFTANSYGSYAQQGAFPSSIAIYTDVSVGKEQVITTTPHNPATKQPASIELHLATGTSYSEQDLHNILIKGGYDLEIKLYDSVNPDSNLNGKVIFTESNAKTPAVTTAQGTITSYNTAANNVTNAFNDRESMIQNAYYKALELASHKNDAADKSTIDAAKVTLEGLKTILDSASVGVTEALKLWNEAKLNLEADPTNTNVQAVFTAAGIALEARQVDYDTANNNYTTGVSAFASALVGITDPGTTDVAGHKLYESLQDIVKAGTGKLIEANTAYTASIATLQGITGSGHTDVNYISGTLVPLANYDTTSATPTGLYTATALAVEAAFATLKTAHVVTINLTDGKGLGKENTNSGEGLVFQIGANGDEDQRVTLSINDMSSTALGLASISVGTRDLANLAIDIVDKAVRSVSLQRAALGALQNRLEYTVNNLTTTEENLTAAESQIRDTDMAEEMINYTKYNILQQAAQAMLAQANQQPQGILQLIGG